MLLKENDCWCRLSKLQKKTDRKGIRRGKKNAYIVKAYFQEGFISLVFDPDFTVWTQLYAYLKRRFEHKQKYHPFTAINISNSWMNKYFQSSRQKPNNVSKIKRHTIAYSLVLLLHVTSIYAKNKLKIYLAICFENVLA